MTLWLLEQRVSTLEAAQEAQAKELARLQEQVNELRVEIAGLKARLNVKEGRK